MVKTQTGPKKIGLTRGKAVLIGVLSIVLVGVLYVQYGKYAAGSDVDVLETVATRGPARKPPGASTQGPAEMSAETGDDETAALLEFDQTKWKTPELSKVIAYDPFALPAGFPRPLASGDLHSTEGDAETAEEKSKQLADALAELRMQLDELKERGVHVIIGQNGQYVAMIGDRTIHVGDKINEFTVTEIDPKEGVRVERKGPE